MMRYILANNKHTYTRGIHKKNVYLEEGDTVLLRNMCTYVVQQENIRLETPTQVMYLSSSRKPPYKISLASFTSDFACNYMNTTYKNLKAGYSMLDIMQIYRGDVLIYEVPFVTKNTIRTGMLFLSREGDLYEYYRGIFFNKKRTKLYIHDFDDNLVPSKKASVLFVTAICPEDISEKILRYKSDNLEHITLLDIILESGLGYCSRYVRSIYTPQ